MDWLPVSSPPAILAALSGIGAFFFWLERRTGWRLFHYLPPLIFIYLTPVVLSNSGVLPTASPVYDQMSRLVLPMMLVLLLLKVNIGGAVRVLGRGVGVMLFGTLGVMVGAPIGLLLVKPWLGPDAWKAFGVLAGSWIGGTGNMAAVSEMIDAGGAEFGLAVLGDSTIYVIWLPILLGSKKFADRFARFSGVEPERLERMEAAIAAERVEARPPGTADLLSLLCVAFAAMAAAEFIATLLPEFQPYLSAGTWRILLITTIGIGLSFTPLSRLPGSHELGMALVYLFVARMGAMAEIDRAASQAVPFLIGSAVWIFIHGAFCLLGAKLLRVDVHTAAIASAANIGGAASASVVASHHQESLVPASILMALMGYAVGNFAAYFTALLCWWVSG
ncbi:hypothetical protein Mal64_02270 [Pseudobythopirellula maris]|uniref:DUF819 family protein n=1 Tax=Pseudobythopirellula maris TaxID=2527991 RepID=A0A5C5ZRH7_9BACT|nr:DUF819 family protein [Pseudobythopirellula maris]TWT89846.1 hypothetical protein Mal64_02270 [Pseudobythopirellula maris]